MIKKEADVIIMGGGITGCSMAYRLAEKGKRVILLDKGRVGEEASGRNGGGIRQQNRNTAELPMAMEAVNIWADMEKELEWDVDYRRNGNLRLVTSEEEFNRLPRKWEREMGLDVEILTPEKTRAIVPAISKNMELFGGTFCPSDGTANPLLATKAIARAAQRNGVEIREHEPAIGLKLKGERVVAAYTQSGEYQASVFVNAAGPWARIICNWIGLDFPLNVRVGQILVSEPLPPLIKPFMSFGYYLRQTLEGHIHFGISSQPVENFDKSSTLFAFQTLGRLFSDVFPCLKNVNVIRTWAGLTSWTPDEKPILDKAPNIDNFFLAGGFSAHGFCLGPSAGKQMAELIVDGKSSLDLNPFKWTRFDGIRLNEL
jgi:sarcosine oxidase subunit beta